MINAVVTSSLEKVLPKIGYNGNSVNRFSALEGETLSFQVVYWGDIGGKYEFSLEGAEELQVKTYFVENVPVDYPSFPHTLSDSGYISHEPALYPNILEDTGRNWVQMSHICHALWFTVSGKSGDYSLKFKLFDGSRAAVAESDIYIDIVNAELPEQELRYTDWFHVDSIADYYGLKIFSEELWSMVEKFLFLAREIGCNMILTPVFTPPLDTEEGSERPTVQLMRITKTGNRYEFDFSLLRRWIKLCLLLGFKYFEMPHLFTQWGAVYTPKIVVNENGEEKKLFGWHVKAVDKEYDNFLSQYLPELIAVLKDEGVFENTYFHISDEPPTEKEENYNSAKNIASKYLKGCTAMDALNHYEMYEKSGIGVPVPSTLSVEKFKDFDLKERWCYYCCGECIDVSNRFIALPSSRNRSIGVQLYKGKMDGFLHWGYNFYYSQLSRILIDPYRHNDAYDGFPAGDAFFVYPAKNGPIPSISSKVFTEGLQDLRALKLLESKIGYEKTVAFAEEILGDTITFSKCFSAEKLLELREKLNRKVAEI